ncbi:MAG: MarR family transcriptional regulator [Acidimicrobiia bacterium]|nr:MarR family transcriptional regulator [Acidimicrobiia bacterium]
MADTEWLDERQAKAWRSLQFMQMRLDAELNRQLAVDSGLSLSDYVVLVKLTDQPDGRLRIFELAHEIGWERSRLSHHVNRMANRGLVTKEACDSDRRGAFVVLTDDGRRAIEEAAPRHVAIVRRLVIDQIDADELDAIGAAAEKVLAALDQAEL